METAMAKAINDMSTLLTPQIVRGNANLVFHSEWDNLNKITTNIHGSNMVNSAGGILIQETKPGYESTQERTLPVLGRAKERSTKMETTPTLPPLHVYNRVGPKFPEGASFTMPLENIQQWKRGMNEYYIWIFVRIIGSHGVQAVPALGGFISATGKAPAKKTTVDYYPPIDEPITEYSTVAELLRRSAEATAEVGQEYVISTFDLGVCMKALPLIWKFPQQYGKHIVLIGQFHQAMNYIGMLCGHKMRGSGYQEILLEAQLVSSGSLNGVLSGKAYAKALYCVKTVGEALERLLVECFVKDEGEGLSLEPAALLDLFTSCNRECLDNALKDDSTVQVIFKLQEYEDSVRNGHLGKTAQFWFSFIEHTRLLLMLLYAVKVNSFPLFHKCIGDMADLFFAYGGQNYAR